MSHPSDPSTWPADEIRSAVRSALGEGPARVNPSPPKQISEQDGGEYRLVEYAYTNGLGERVPLSVAEPRQRKFKPAVLAIHQTNDCGRKEVFGLAGDPTLDYGRRLARRGHRVFAIDLAWTGERAEGPQWDKSGFYERFPEWSMIGHDIEDLRELGIVMRDHFSESSPPCHIGHSLGGVLGYFFCALEGCVSQLACNACYFGTPTDEDAWAAQLYTSRVLNDRIRSFCIARHLDLLVSLAAVQTEMLLLYYRDDRIIDKPVPSEAELTRMKALSSQVQVIGLDGGHAFSEAAQEQCCAFLEQHG